jgi:acyl carrier protein
VIPESDAIRAAACESAAKVAGRSIKDEEKLVSSGLIDSLSVLRLISLMEKKLGILIPPDTLQPEDFDDVETIVETIQRVANPPR